jgi:hypothetical protein
VAQALRIDYLSTLNFRRMSSMRRQLLVQSDKEQSDKEVDSTQIGQVSFVVMSRSEHPTAFLHRLLSSWGVSLLVLGLFLFATQAKLSKYYADERSKTSTFKSTKCTENRSDQIVEFEVIEIARPSINRDSSKRSFDHLAEPVCKIRTLFHPYPFRPPPA